MQKKPGKPTRKQWLVKIVKSEVRASGLSGPGQVNGGPALQQLRAWKERCGEDRTKSRVFISECAWSLEGEVLTPGDRSVFTRGGKACQLEGK